MCSKAGLIPCLASLVLATTQERCIQITIVPKAKYRNITAFAKHHSSLDLHRKKREITTGISVATLVGLRLEGSETGIMALATQSHGLSSLKADILADVSEVRTSIISLEKSHSSLVEVVLQNRRGLNLVFQ